MSALSPDSIYIPLYSADYSHMCLNTLLDSGSSHCFIDISIAQKFSLSLRSIPPILLRLFNGTSNCSIQFSVELPVSFPSGETMPLTFYVTTLDSQTSAVLGYNWLTHHNPLVDWASGHIHFRTPVVSSVPTSPAPGQSPPDDLPTIAFEKASPAFDSVTPSPSSQPLPVVHFIGAPAFARACKLPGFIQLRLFLCAASANSAPEKINLSTVPDEYHEYADVFSDIRANTLAPHHLYDLKIDLEEGQPIPPGPIYSLSALEQQALR